MPYFSWCKKQDSEMIKDADLHIGVIHGLSAQKIVKLEENGAAILQGEKGEPSSEKACGTGISSNDYAVVDKCRFLLDVINSVPAKCDFDSVKDKAVSKLSELIEGF